MVCASRWRWRSRQAKSYDMVFGTHTLERYEVVVIELACLQPLDRAEEQHLPRDWFRPAPT